MNGWVLACRESIDGVKRYFDGENVTENLNAALVIANKDKYIEFMQKHEQSIIDEFGPNAICDAGYTNMMKNFEFVEVEYSQK